MNNILHNARLIILLIMVTGSLSCERLSEMYRFRDGKGIKIAKGSDETGKDNTQDPCGEPVIIRLVDRDNQTASPATVMVKNDLEKLTVTFEVTEGSRMMDMMYLQVGSLDAVPLADDGAYPAFWDFSLQYADNPVASHAFEIPLADLDDCFVILAQAHVVEGEDAVVTWSEGINPGWTSGPFYTEYCVELCSGDATGTEPEHRYGWKGRYDDDDDDDADADDDDDNGDEKDDD